MIKMTSIIINLYDNGLIGSIATKLVVDERYEYILVLK